MGSGKDYKLEAGPNRIGLAEYRDAANRRFLELLSSDPAEKEVQLFLEKHPSMVPGPLSPYGGSGHFPLYCSLITQPELPGVPSYVPDFMWIARHSGAWFPTLIEIEKPGRKIFTGKGDPTSEFSHARNQLNHWRSWFNNPTNVHQFMDLYGISTLWNTASMRLRMILVYGRRAEFEDKPGLRSIRDGLLPGTDEELMSFDRLGVNLLMEDAITIKSVGRGKYEAVSIPSLFATGPDLANRLLHVEGMSEALDRNGEIDEERREFLKRRILLLEKLGVNFLHAGVRFWIPGIVRAVLLALSSFLAKISR